MPVISGLTYQVTASTIVATWTTDVSSDSNLSAGGKAAIDNGVAANSTSHQCIVTGLAPSTLYSCVVTSGGTSSSPQNVTTAALDTRFPIFNAAVGTPSKVGNNHGDTLYNFVSSDNKTYIQMDDGYGFASGLNAGANMQIAVLTNEATLLGSQVNLLTNYGGFATSNGTDGPSGAALSDKLSGMFGFGGNLYAFHGRNQYAATGHPLQGVYGNDIIKSTDHGATWNSWQSPGSPTANGVPPSPLGTYQFAPTGWTSPIRYAIDDGTIGYNTAGNQIDGANGYVYITYTDGYWDNGNNMYLCRIPRIQFQAQSSTAFQYWIGPSSPTAQQFVTDSNWSSSAASPTAIYSATGQVGSSDLTFIPALNSYLLLTWYNPTIGTSGPVSSSSVWNILTGPTPAGPWNSLSTPAFNPTGYYNPVVLHRSAASNSSTIDINLSLLLAGDYLNGQQYYYPTVANLTLNMPTFTQIASDNFTRANENPLANSVWTTLTGTNGCQIVSNVCEASVKSVNCCSRYSGIAWPADQYAAVTVGAKGSANDGITPTLRCSASAQTYYLWAIVYSAVTTSTFYKCVAGTFTSLGNPAGQTWATGDIALFSVQGTTFSFYRNGSLITTITDSSISSGSPGIGGFINSTNLSDATATLWTAGAFQAATPTFSPVAGTYTGTQSVTVSSTTSGASGFAMYYTTDGTTPTTGSTLYSGPISVVSSETLKVLATATDYVNSTVGSAAYVINASGGGIGTVKTSGAGTPAVVTNSSGFAQLITTPTTSGKLGAPVPVVFCDSNGNELAITGSNKGSNLGTPTPVVLTDATGKPITPEFTFTSNSNSIVITSTKTGNHLGAPIPVILTDPNGYAYITTSLTSSGNYAGSPTPITLTDSNGNIFTLTIGT